MVCGDELAWLAGTGFAEAAAAQVTDPAMLYGIASITKTFTGTAIMQFATRAGSVSTTPRWHGCLAGLDGQPVRSG